jgi:hypothetical protein
MADKTLIEFIKEARRRGFEDYEIRKPLLERGWTLEQLKEAFAELKETSRYKNQISVYLDSRILHSLEKRAKRNLLTISEQIEDIVRRSVAVSRRRTIRTPEKLDDLLVGLFSRKR